MINRNLQKHDHPERKAKSQLAAQVPHSKYSATLRQERSRAQCSEHHSTGPCHIRCAIAHCFARGTRTDSDSDSGANAPRPRKQSGSRRFALASTRTPRRRLRRPEWDPSPVSTRPCRLLQAPQVSSMEQRALTAEALRCDRGVMDWVPQAQEAWWRSARSHEIGNGHQCPCSFCAASLSPHSNGFLVHFFLV